MFWGLDGLEALEGIIGRKMCCLSDLRFQIVLAITFSPDIFQTQASSELTGVVCSHGPRTSLPNME